MSEETAVTRREEVAEVMTSLWWLPLIRGILMILIGAYALFRPGMTMAALTQVIGVFVVIEGILAIVSAVVGEIPSRGWTALRGVLMILVGIFVFSNALIVTIVTAKVVMFVLAFSAIFAGVLEIIAAIRDRKEIEGEGWLIFAGVLAILFGLFLLAAPMAFGIMMVRILGAFAIISGISLMVFAFRVRGIGKAIKKSGAE